VNIFPLPAARKQLAHSVESFRRLADVVGRDRRLRSVVLVLIALDLLFTLYFAVAKALFNLEIYAGLYYHKELLITADGGVPEWFNYLKTIAIVVLMLRVYRGSRQPVYAALMVLFFVILLDDAMMIHESMGREFRYWFDLSPVWGLRAQDVGELITWGILGVLLGPVTILAVFRSESRHRGNGLAMLLPFGVLVLCGMFVDQLYNSLSDLFTNAGVLLDVVEDGGEMLAITAILAMALGIAAEQRAIFRGAPGSG
jgi:hypothetical protein